MNSNVHILLVEDEAITAMLIKRQLNKKGYDFLDHVTTGEKAIANVRQNSPDVILMDIKLSGTMDGIQAATSIRSESDTKIIFITGYDDDIFKEKAQIVNPIGYLLKPLEIKKLGNIITENFK